MVAAKDYLELGLQLHGHKCPAMPLGLRAGAAAMNELGVERTGDSALLTVSEVLDYDYQEPPHTFDSFVCEQCSEMTVLQYGRIGQDGKKICQDCAGY